MQVRAFQRYIPLNSPIEAYHIDRCHRMAYLHHTLYKFYQVCKMESHWNVSTLIRKVSEIQSDM